MKILIDNLLEIKGVLGVLVFSSDSRILFQDLKRLEFDGLKQADLEMPLSLFDRVEELDLLFERYRIYIRKYPLGLIWVIMQPDSSAAMIRLQCDVIAPRMEQEKPVKKGFGRLFK
jgi:hypothetical protein